MLNTCQRALAGTQAAGEPHGRLPTGRPTGRDLRERASQHYLEDSPKVNTSAIAPCLDGKVKCVAGRQLSGSERVKR